VFLPVVAAVPAVRRFVTAALKGWGLDQLVADGTVVAAELATNSVSHSASPFRATVTRSESKVRIAIEDVNPSVPQLVHAAPEAFGGRGIAIVAELAQAWGCDETASGKLVWADLSLPSPARISR
jgi:anti-sigma regulatory factor (Ser/Thr protein kinase)